MTIPELMYCNYITSHSCDLYRPAKPYVHIIEVHRHIRWLKMLIMFQDIKLRRSKSFPRYIQMIHSYALSLPTSGAKYTCDARNSFMSKNRRGPKRCGSINNIIVFQPWYASLYCVWGFLYIYVIWCLWFAPTPQVAQ